MTFKKRTQEEIVERINKVKELDILNTWADLIIYLDFEHAKPFLKESSKPEEWKQYDYTEEAVIKEMENYMTFAWEKARGERGISASRSIMHFQHWLFLLGDDEMLKFAEDDGNYSMYGKPILTKICEKYKFGFKGKF